MGVGAFSDGSGTPDLAHEFADAPLDALRRHLADRLGLRGGRHAWAWITEFPMFDWSPEIGRVVAAHHPFTMPHLDDIETPIQATAKGPADPAAQQRLYEAGLRSRAYDSVYNGHEMASGSIRIHDQRLQRHVFRALGLTEAEAEAKFGFLLEALARRSASWRVRFRIRSTGDAAGGPDQLARCDRVSQDDGGAGSVRGRSAPVSNDELRELHVAVTKSGAKEAIGKQHDRAPR